MPFTLDRFVALRPYLFHLTAQGNLNGIMDTRTLFPAAILLSVNGRILPRLTPRKQHLRAEHRGRSVWIRDQRPLHAGNIDFEAGWDMPRLLAHLDGHVFFWPGKRDGMPIDYGVRHYERYAHENPALLRIRTAAMFEANPHLVPLFCPFNSGAPRINSGRRIPRGAGTFLNAASFSRTAGHVKEVVFNAAVSLPSDTEFSHDYREPWRRLS